MSARARRRWLWLLNAALACAIVAGAAVAVLLPCTMPEQPTVVPEAHPRARRQDAPRLPPLASLEPLWSLDLRRPLADPPVAAAPPPARPPAARPFPAQLLGTAVEEDKAEALFLLGPGKIQLRGVGDAVAGGRVLDIRAGRVTVEYLGRRTVLRVQPGQRAR